MVCDGESALSFDVARDPGEGGGRHGAPPLELTLHTGFSPGSLWPLVCSRASAMRLDLAIVLGLATLLGQRSVSAPWAVAAVAIGTGLLLHRKIAVPSLCAAALALSVGALRASIALSTANHDRETARDALGPPSRCEAVAIVRSSPTLKKDALRWDANLSSIVCDNRAIPIDMRARLYGGPVDLARGDSLDVVITIAPTQLFLNPDVPDPRPVAARSATVVSGSVILGEYRDRSMAPPAWIDRLRAYVRSRIDATYSPEAAPLARALVIGETDLDDDDDEAFRRSGLSHLLAVSGTHLILVVAGFVSLARRWFARVPAFAASRDVGRVAALLGVVVAFVYADFSGGSGSARRAAVMLAISLGAAALGRRSTGQRALGGSMLVLALVDPLAAYDVSLLLSVAATAGLMGISRPIVAWLERVLPSPLDRLASPLGASLGASLACAPVLTSLSPSLPLIGVIANLIAVPVGEVAALPLCLAHVALAWAPPIERGLALAGSGALDLLAWIARTAAAPSWSVLAVPPLTTLQAIALALGVTAVIFSEFPRKITAVVTIAALLLAELTAIRSGSPRSLLRVTHLDVGQGDSTLVDLPDGQTMLIDGGGFVGSPVDPGLAVVLPVLRARRRSRVDIAVLSHPHPDHFLGLASALPKLDVGELWDSGQGEEEGAGPVYAAMIEGLRRRDIPVRRPADLCAAPRSIGGASLELLAPCPSFHPLGHANDNSLVLKISYGHRSVLLVGDAEAQEEGELLASHRDRLRADVLKVGHHGSRTSSTRPFLDAVNPSLAVMSCGVRNRFGHPHPKTLATLSQAKLPYARTDRGGAVIWETNGESMSIRRGDEITVW